MTNENIRIVEPVIMRLKHPSETGILSKTLKEFHINYTKESEEKQSVILEVYNDSEINSYLFHWLEMVSEIPGIEKSYPQELGLITAMETYELGFVEYIENEAYNIVSIIPIDLKYNIEKGTTLYLCKLTQHG